MASRKENAANGYGSAEGAAEDLHNETLTSPPKPARSAFMCFSDAKEKELMSSGAYKKKELIKRVAEAWRALSSKERAFWDEEARNDKLRFVRQKAAYKGPWDLPKRRAKKHPLAPKRPMSAFLKFSQTRRKQVKEENPDMSNTDVSRLLGEMWRNASPRERAPYVEQEQRERAVYKKDIARFREGQAKLDAASRTSHQSVQQMGKHPALAAVYEETHPRAAEPRNVVRNQAVQRPYAEYARPEPIAAVPSHEDSLSLHEFRVPHFDPYAGSQYSSRGPPPIGSEVTFSLSDEHPTLSRGMSHDGAHTGNAQPLPPPHDFDDIAFSRSRYFTDSPRYYGHYSRYP